MKPFTLIAIVGMHRSGTSLMAEAINRLGVPLAENLLQANEFNKRGYFEDIKVVEIHDKLLSEMGRPWGTIRHSFALPTNWMRHKAAKNAKSKLLTYLRKQVSKQSSANKFAIKDPRLSLFLPLWNEICEELGIELKLVVCLRDIESVAESLNVRDGAPLDSSRVIWANYNSAIVEATLKLEHMVVAFPRWRKNPDAVFKALAKFCECDQPPAALDVFDKKMTGRVNRPSVGTYLEWQSSLRELEDQFEFSDTFKQLAENHINSLLNFQVWADFIEDDVLKDSAYARLEYDLAHYKVKVKQQDREIGRLSKDIKNSTKEAAENLEAYNVSSESEKANTKAISALTKDVANASKEAKKNLSAYQDASKMLEARDIEIKDLEANFKKALKTAEQNTKAYQDASKMVEAKDIEIKDLEANFKKTLKAAERHIKAYQDASKMLEAKDIEIKDLEANFKKALKAAERHIKAYQDVSKLLLEKDTEIEKLEINQKKSTKSAQEFHKAYRETSLLLESRNETISNLQDELKEVVSVADRHLEAYRIIEAEMEEIRNFSKGLDPEALEAKE